MVIEERELMGKPRPPAPFLEPGDKVHAIPPKAPL